MSSLKIVNYLILKNTKIFFFQDEMYNPEFFYENVKIPSITLSKY